ncbi:hypothetical protein ACN38_g10288 [Penicillium nordicum]|uniref:Uncharacterized protein n=1 Tax=Penicillium nordicum TaxID=229535 RepID=A0A0M8P0P6_9EURO|nr:hypothetical protein ACN38_g10288 [Penicillium nordicum]
MPSVSRVQRSTADFRHILRPFFLHSEFKKKKKKKKKRGKKRDQCQFHPPHVLPPHPVGLGFFIAHRFCASYQQCLAHFLSKVIQLISRHLVVCSTLATVHCSVEYAHPVDSQQREPHLPP